VRFVVLVEDSKGTRKTVKVKAAGEAAIRPGLEKRGFKVLRFAALADEPTQRPEAAGVEAGGQGDFTPDGIEEAMLGLEQGLEDAETCFQLIPVGNLVKMSMGHPQLSLPTLTVLAKNTVRQIASGRTAEEIHQFLLETARVPEKLAGMLIGMSIDTGKIAVEISAGKRTKEEGIRHILQNAPGAEDAMVRPLVERILPLARTLDPKAFLARLQGFE
jgi:hypothetical protein